jgi:hypothetical protein
MFNVGLLENPQNNSEKWLVESSGPMIFNGKKYDSIKLKSISNDGYLTSHGKTTNDLNYDNMLLKWLVIPTPYNTFQFINCVYDDILENVLPYYLTSNIVVNGNLCEITYNNEICDKFFDNDIQTVDYDWFVIVVS